jgi:CPA2 family monovalent cation:H+ antiporter-2
MHDAPLLVDIAVGLGFALIGGVIAKRLRLPPLVGYLLAGVAIGPFTPGFVGDQQAIQTLAELGVLFLMFGVGLHFSFGDLWQVRTITIPGPCCRWWRPPHSGSPSRAAGAGPPARA